MSDKIDDKQAETGEADDMSPTNSPDTMQKKNGTRRVNNRPMYILLGVCAAFFLIIAMVSMQRTADCRKSGE